MFGIVCFCFHSIYFYILTDLKFIKKGSSSELSYPAYDMVPSIESCIPSEILMPKDRLHNLSKPDLEAKRSAFERFQSSCNEKFQAIQQVQQDSNRKEKNSKLAASHDTTTITKPVPAYTSTYLAIAVMTKGVESTKKSSEFERIERIVMLERSPHGSAYFVEGFDD